VVGGNSILLLRSAAVARNFPKAQPIDAASRASDGRWINPSLSMSQASIVSRPLGSYRQTASPT